MAVTMACFGLGAMSHWSNILHHAPHVRMQGHDVGGVQRRLSVDIGAASPPCLEEECDDHYSAGSILDTASVPLSPFWGLYSRPEDVTELLRNGIVADTSMKVGIALQGDRQKASTDAETTQGATKSDSGQTPGALPRARAVWRRQPACC